MSNLLEHFSQRVPKIFEFISKIKKKSDKYAIIPMLYYRLAQKCRAANIFWQFVFYFYLQITAKSYLCR